MAKREHVEAAIEELLQASFEFENSLISYRAYKERKQLATDTLLWLCGVAPARTP